MLKKIKDQRSETKASTPKMPKLSILDFEILMVLFRVPRMYGLEILQALNHKRPNQLMFGSVYPVLNRLEAKGFIDWKWGDETEKSGGARRKYYNINALGKQVVQETLDYHQSLDNQDWKENLSPEAV